MEIWLVILFLSRKKFHAKQMCLLSSSMKLGPVLSLGVSQHMHETNLWKFVLNCCMKTIKKKHVQLICVLSDAWETCMSDLSPSSFLTMFYIITPLTNIVPFHWFRARHMICLSFTRRQPGDSASVCRALVRRLSHGVQYPDVRCVYEDDNLIVCNHFGLHDTTCSTVKVFATCIRDVRGL